MSLQEREIYSQPCFKLSKTQVRDMLQALTNASASVHHPTPQGKDTIFPEKTGFRAGLRRIWVHLSSKEVIV